MFFFSFLDEKCDVLRPVVVIPKEWESCAWAPPKVETEFGNQMFDKFSKWISDEIFKYHKKTIGNWRPVSEGLHDSLIAVSTSKIEKDERVSDLLEGEEFRSLCYFFFLSYLLYPKPINKQKMSRLVHKLTTLSSVESEGKSILQTKSSNKKTTQTSHHNSKLNTSIEKFRNDNQKKPVQLLFNAGRIMPKVILKDKQRLYEENVRLREELRDLQEEVVRLKTRVIVSEQEAFKAIQSNLSDHSNPNPEHSQPYLQNRKISWLYLQSQNSLRQQIKAAKQEISTLHKENEKLHKNIKYTKISQLTIQNQRLLTQCTRMKQLLDTANSKIMKDSRCQQREVDGLRIDIDKLKQINKMISLEVLNKTRHCEVYQYQLEKRKEREILYAEEIKGLRKQIEKLNQLVLKNDNMEQINRQTDMSKKKSDNSHSTSELKKTSEILKKSQIRNKSSKKLHQIQTSKQTKKSQGANQGQKRMQQNKKISKVPQNPIKSRQPIIPSFKKDEDKNQIIFHHKNRYQEVNAKQEQQPNKDKQKENQNQKEKEKQSIRLQEIKEVLSYRFQCQRYTFDDLDRDIKKYEINQLEDRQLRNLLSSQPFLLSDSTLQVVLKFLYKNSPTPPTPFPISQLLPKLRLLITDMPFLPQHKQQQVLKKWQQIVTLNKKRIISQTKVHRYLPKQQFQHMLISALVKKEQLDVLIGEAAMVSEGLWAVDVQGFVDRIEGD